MIVTVPDADDPDADERCVDVFLVSSTVTRQGTLLLVVAKDIVVMEQLYVAGYVLSVLRCRGEVGANELGRSYAIFCS